jgi:hypothetical protein
VDVKAGELIIRNIFINKLMSKQLLLEEFEREYCNNHNRKIRWLRGVFIDQEDQIR